MDLTSATKTSTLTDSQILSNKLVLVFAFDQLLFYYIYCFAVENQQLQTRPV